VSLPLWWLSATAAKHDLGLSLFAFSSLFAFAFQLSSRSSYFQQSQLPSTTQQEAQNRNKLKAKTKQVKSRLKYKTHISHQKLAVVVGC